MTVYTVLICTWLIQFAVLHRWIGCVCVVDLRCVQHNDFFIFLVYVYVYVYVDS